MSGISREPFPMTPKKRALIEATLRKEGLLSAQTDRILPRNDSGPAPLSFAQQRLWFFDQFEPGSPLYNLMSPILFEGRLDAGALEKAFNRIVERHEALRTTFDFREGQPVQIVARVQPLKLSLLDLTPLTEQQQRQRMESVFAEEANRPFDLKSGPLLRITLLRLDREKHVLVFAVHHIVSDAWSTALLVHELGEIYASLTTGRPASLPELPLQYSDFAVWQRNWLQGPVLEQQLEYWKQHLDNSLPVLELPADRPRPAVRTFNGAAVSFSFPRALSESLKVLAQSQRATLFMALLAAFKVLLLRYTGLEDFAIAIPIANRQRQELEHLIGFFTNTLAVRTDLSGNPTFVDFLKRVRENLLDAYVHQDLPFELLVEKLHPERTLSHSPLVQVMFVLKNQTEPDLEFPGVTATPLKSDFSTAKFDLTVFLDDRENQIHGAIEYNTDIFGRDRIQRMADHFQTLLAAIVQNPAQHISDLPLLTEMEKRQLLAHWNNTQAVYPQLCAHQLFEQQVERAPNATAVLLDGRELSYTQLNARANQIARYLRARGIAQGAIAGILMERSAEMIAAILGILKAGATCLPLNPSYPGPRLAFMLEDSEAQAALVDGMGANIPPGTAPVIHLDEVSAQIAQESEANPQTVIDAESGLYVIYTSGSTGIPKGVVMPHRALVNLVEWHRASGSRNGRVLQFASLTFDVSFQEIFSTLAAGGTLVLLPEDARTDTAALAKIIERDRVERFHLPVVLLQKLAESFCRHPQPLLTLREVMVGGEQLHVTKPMIDLFARLSECTLYNHYGPSETHVVTSFRLEGPPETWPSLPPLGRPIANARTYVLDSHFQPVPVGIPGELYLGGDCLAHGYLKRPALTAERFLPDPFSGLPGQRLYKTGDLVRYLPSGDIEFLGRNDFQVKIRGMRIELGEIEVELRRHPGIQEAAVMVHQNGHAEKRLAAYVACHPAEAITPKNLRAFLRERLPEHMVPSHFVMLESFPLTSSGKINRLALPSPDAVPEVESDSAPPETSIEKVLAEIFAEVLGRKTVGVLDNFFDLGGHSLMATQIASRVRDAFRIELPVRMIFEEPSVRGLARSILKDHDSQTRIERTAELLLELSSAPAGKISIAADASHADLAEIPPAGERQARMKEEAAPPVLGKVLRTAPLSFAQQRLWFLDQYEPQNTLYNLPAALHLHGRLNVQALEAGLNEIVRRHESLRTTFGVADDHPVQIIHQSLALALPVTDLEDLPEEEKQKTKTRWIEMESEQPFDLAAGPLIRTTLLRLGPEDHLFLLTMHHIVSDGWSLQVFVHELTVLYDAFCNKKNSPLPELSTQYADFAAWQRKWLQGSVLSEQLAYWKEQLVQAPLLLELPSDRPRPAYKTFDGAALLFKVPQDVARQLLQLSRREGATLFMTLLSAFYALLYRYTREEDIVIGTPIANRNRRETEELIGFFINTLVLRTRVSGELSFRELLQKVRETCLSAYTHQDVPFEKLVEEIQPERNLSHSPLFQVMFHLQNVLRDELRLTGLSISPLHAEIRKSKFDLSLALTETPEGLNGILNYNTSIFNADSAARTAGHFQKILESAVAAPDQEISSLPMLTSAERHQLLIGWNDFRRDYGRNLLLHEVLEKQAAARPLANAVRFQGQVLTYGELNRRANQLAHHLRRMGIGPEKIVAICMERSLEMMVGVLGILKSGGAYLPLDPSYPEARLAFMLEDAGVEVIVTDEFIAPQLAHFRVQRVRLGPTAADLASDNDDESLENPSPLVTADNLAYAIYTSGSTGKPKGIMVGHGNLANYVGWASESIFDDATETVPAVQGLTFDGSLKQIFAPLLRGLEIWMLSRTEMADPVSLLQALGAHRDRRFSAVPSLWKSLLEALESGQAVLPPGVITHAFVGGEELPRDLVDRTFALFPDLLLWNLYGPSETTGTASVALIRPGEDITIGHPIAGKKFHILDEQLEPVPIGVAGEIYIGREGVARGYLGRPDLTAAGFIPDPFSDEPGARLYRTRDRARYLSDGRIQFLGRFDHQVKLRGFRIELGEIEAALREHPEVADAAAAIRQNAENESYLAAYVVPHDSTAPGELRAFLKDKLPDYMLPSAWVVLEKLPLTPNGKLDRKALPQPEPGKREIEAPVVAPRSAVEKTLAEIFADILGVAQVGIHDNFFELGGHSLLATRVVARIRKVFNTELPLRQFFEQATVAGIAAMLAVQEAVPGRMEETAALLQKLESLSTGDLEELLRRKKAKEGR